MNLQEKNFYSQIGLICIRFAKLENLIIQIVSKLINSDEDLVSLMLIENNALHQNLQVLSKLNNYRGFEEEQVKELLKSIDNLRINRNLFIHGIWSEVLKIDGETFILCDERKIKFIKLENGRRWEHNRHKKVSLDDLKSEVLMIEKNIEIALSLLSKINDIDFRYH